MYPSSVAVVADDETPGPSETTTRFGSRLGTWTVSESTTCVVAASIVYDPTSRSFERTPVVTTEASTFPIPLVASTFPLSSSVSKVYAPASLASLSVPLVTLIALILPIALAAIITFALSELNAYVPSSRSLCIVPDVRSGASRLPATVFAVTAPVVTMLPKL